MELSLSKKANNYSANIQFANNSAEPNSSLLFQQEPNTRPYPKQDQSSPLQTFLKIYLISSFHLALSLPTSLFPSEFPTKTF
jgi:hypothetical protein